jgi:hypothetical protein
MGRKNFKLSEKNIRRFVIRQIMFVTGIIIAISILGVVETAVNTFSADTVVESAADQFSGRKSRLEMDVSIKTANSLSFVVSISAILIVLVLTVLLVLEWIPVIRRAMNKLNIRVKEE